jgi:hypothetical protein
VPKSTLSARILLSLLSAAVWLSLSSAPAGASIWFVSASASAKGDGSFFHPFNSLVAVQNASAPNDQILVLPAKSTVPPLDGGITLKPGQKLIGLDPFATLADADDPAPRITNSSASLNGGSAVVLSNNNEVANLVILNSWKSGILGTDVVAANVHDNQITGQNQSCTEGFRIFAFSVVVGTVTIPIPGISGGWAAIEFEYAGLSNAAKINVQRNNIHDADCGDGVDVQLHNATKVTANVNANVFQNLQQGVFGDGPYNTVLGIGTQTSDNSMLTLNAAYNYVNNLGNGTLPLGANADGFLINLGGFSQQNVHIDHHTYENTDNLGGSSANGFETAIMQNGGAQANVLIENSAFSGATSDIVQFNFLGGNSTINATVKNSVIKDSTGLGYIPVVSVGNNGTCVEAYNEGVNSTLSLNVINSRPNCVAQGIGIFNQLAAPSIKLNVERSLISGNTYSNIIFDTIAPVGDLAVKVENSQLTDSPGRGIEFDQTPGLTTSSAIDFGGGTLGSAGNNSIFGNTLDASIGNYDVSAKSDWWGSASGPSPSAIDLIGSATLEFVPFLTQAPF